MRCPRCGNENPATNRFCGMCGTTLLPATATVGVARAEGSATAPASTPRPVVSAPITSAPVAPAAPPVSSSAAAQRSEPPMREAEPAPVINGPSFLGLNQPAPSPSKSRRGSLSIDPGSAHSGNLDYLLEDEEPRNGGAGKFVLIVVALLLAVGFGYLRFKNGGFSWLNSSPKKPAAAVEQNDGGDASAPAVQTAPAGGTSSAAAPANGSITPEPAPGAGTAASPPSSSTPASSTPAASPASDTGTAAASGEKTGAPPAATAPPAKDSAKDAAAAKDATAAKDAADGNSDEDKSSDDNEAPVAKPKAAVAAPKPSPAAPVDVVAQAQKYIYGKGAAQDCDRGMRLLKPAADRGDTKAMIQMGALYSAGLCAPHDLPTSYRWFAKALHKEPDNQSVQNDLQKLWGEMTQPERQLAIRLSQ